MILRALIRTRLAALRRSFVQRSGKKRSRGVTILFAALMLYALGCMVFLAAAADLSICRPLADAGLGWLYFATAGLSAFTVGFFLTVFMAERQLFAARDNELLLSLPIPARDILASRMVLLAVCTYFSAALLLIPAGVVYEVQVGFSASARIAYLVMSLVLPLGSLALACFAGQGLAWLSARARHKSLSSILATAAFLAVYFSALGNGNRALALLVEKGDQAAAAVRVWAAPAYWFGTGAVGGAGAAVLACALPLAAFALVYWWLSRSFYRITTVHVAAPKVRYREKRAAQQSAARAVWLCELRHFGATPGWVVNGGMGAVMAVLAGAMLLVKRDLLMQLFALDGMLPASSLLACAVSFCLGMCLISSAAVSLQAKNLWVLQSCPVSGGTVLHAMAAVQMTVTLPAAELSVLLGAFGLGLDAAELLAVLASTAAYAVFTAYLGALINVCLPKLDWLTETQAVKQSMSTFFAMLTGFALAAAEFGVCYWLRAAVPPPALLAASAGIYAAGAAAVSRWLSRAGAARFAAL